MTLRLIERESIVDLCPAQSSRLLFYYRLLFNRQYLSGGTRRSSSAQCPHCTISSVQASRGLRSGRGRFVRPLPRYLGQVRLLHRMSATASGLPDNVPATTGGDSDGDLPVPVQKASAHARVYDDAGSACVLRYRHPPCCLLRDGKHQHPEQHISQPSDDQGEPESWPWGLRERTDWVPDPNGGGPPRGPGAGLPLFGLHNILPHCNKTGLLSGASDLSERGPKFSVAVRASADGRFTFEIFTVSGEPWTLEFESPHYSSPGDAEQAGYEAIAANGLLTEVGNARRARSGQDLSSAQDNEVEPVDYVLTGDSPAVRRHEK